MKEKDESSTEESAGMPEAKNAPSAAPAATPENDPNNYYERLVRVSADFDNFRKRYQKEKNDWQRYGAENFIKSFLPVIDNLERAITLCPEEPAAIRQGLKMVLEQMYRNLQSEGVVPFSPQGEPFDPLLHEAITTVEDENQPPHTVVAVHHKGFKLWDRLLRTARVTVTLPKATASQTTATTTTESEET